MTCLVPFIVFTVLLVLTSLVGVYKEVVTEANKI